MLTYPDALQRLFDAATPVQDRRVLPLAAAAGRILAANQFAQVSVPSLDNSAMDGYAVRSADLDPGSVSGSPRVYPVSQRIAAGKVRQALEPGTVARIFTGAPLPAGADAVMMQEQAETVEGGVRFTGEPPHPGQHIRRLGEDMAQGEQILAAGALLRSQELSLAAAAGLPELPVLRRVRVALFSTGDELQMPGQPLSPGGVYNSNHFALSALLEGMGCEVRSLGHIPDTLAATRAALRQAAGENDLILTSGGVSVGEEDHVKPAVELEGGLDLWRIAIKPGKPLAFGHIRCGSGDLPERRFFVGLPGNPVSAFVTFLMLVRPFIQRLQGRLAVSLYPYFLPAGFSWTRDTPLHEFLRVRRNAAGELELFANQGSGVTRSLVWSEGLAIKLPHAIIAPGAMIPFFPFSELLS